MRFRHALAIALLFTVALGTAGCKGEYYFNFKEQQDLSDSKGEWTVREDPELCYFTDEGLRIVDVNLACPKMFSGDFVVTTVFDLMVDPSNRYNFGVVLCDGDFYLDSENDLHMEFAIAGSNMERFDIYEHSDTGGNVFHTDSVTQVLFDELVRDGENCWVVEKTGDVITLSVNGNQFAQFNLEGYASKWFCPNVFAYNLDPVDSDYGFTLRSMLVTYDGSMTGRK